MMMNPSTHQEDLENSSPVIITLDNIPQHSTIEVQLQQKLGKQAPKEEIPFSYKFNLKQVIKLDRKGLEIPNDDDDDDEEAQEEEDEEEEEEFDERQVDLDEEAMYERHYSGPIEGGMPNCVTISHQFQCIIVGADGQLLFLDFNTKKFIKGIRLHSSFSDIAIEKDGYRGGEALIVSFTRHTVEKYDLESLFKSNETKPNIQPLWISGTKKTGDSGRGFTDEFNYNWPEMIAICYSNKYDSFRNEHDDKKLGNILFVCDKWNNRIKILNTFDGKQLKIFGEKGNSRELGSNIEFREPWGISLDNQDRIWVSQFAGHCVKRLENQVGQMVVDQCLGDSMIMYNPLGIFYDKLGNRLLIADSGECTISILDLESGNFMDSITNSSFRCVSDVCINYETGELYVTDQYSEQLFIYE
ncbi:predicted protein [Naegleria gruberi]|uniref:Predicted protein n=1 Tax=Naegleria gruberi TaxID=5762 RepID=D2VJW6_NAEGR|nr:uncharacterized protein NAEGRDRAFT_50156 [Naegleria gruberi]EFC42841.1 predicted protein [Naegleria gruberi]|eukprot:XP_002675585.1 predicted protein [Naegleria gruberi strain NEG-M]